MTNGEIGYPKFRVLKSVVCPAKFLFGQLLKKMSVFFLNLVIQFKLCHDQS